MRRVRCRRKKGRARGQRGRGALAATAAASCVRGRVATFAVAASRLERQDEGVRTTLLGKELHMSR